jgi:hypothetical protein
MTKQHYLIAFASKRIGTTNWVYAHTLTDIGPAAWLRGAQGNERVSGSNWETRIVAAIPISAAEYKANKGHIT